jgi:hypothetical protein
LGCPEALGGAAGNDYPDQTPILIGTDPAFGMTWASGPYSTGIAKVKASATTGQVRIVFVITGGQYAGTAGHKTKLKGIVGFTPSDTYTCADDSDPIEATDIASVGSLIIKRE